MGHGDRAFGSRYQDGFREQEELVFGLRFKFFIAFIADRKRLNLIKNCNEIRRAVDVQTMNALTWQGGQ